MTGIDKELLQEEIYHFFTKTLAERQQYKDYYENKQQVNKGKIISGRPNNLLRVGICKYISDVHTGYFLGVNPTFDFSDQILGNRIKNIMKNNNFPQFLYSLAQDMSIYGTGFCLVCGDQNNIKCLRQNPEMAFIIYDETLEKMPIMAVRFYKITKTQCYGEVYIKGGKYPFIYSDKQVELGVFEKLYTKQIPLFEFQNNGERTGDFSHILTLVDAYNVLLSGAMDDMQSVANAFLALYGMSGTTKEDIEQANLSRVLSLSENGRAEFVVKNVNPSAIDSLKKTLFDDMLMVTMTPNMADDSFGNSSSGVAIQYKLWGIEQLRSQKERFFTKALFTLFYIIYDILSIDYDSLNIAIRFYKNLPQDTKQICENLEDIGDILSHQTKLELLPFVGDAQAELNRIKNERGQ